MMSSVGWGAGGAQVGLGTQGKVERPRTLVKDTPVCREDCSDVCTQDPLNGVPVDRRHDVI